MDEYEKEIGAKKLEDVTGALQKTQELLEIMLRYPLYDDAGEYLQAAVKSINQISKTLMEFK
jgi:hypothetical protein